MTQKAGPPPLQARTPRADRLAALQREQQRSRRRARLLMGSGITVIVGLLVAIAVAAVSAGGGSTGAAGPLVVPRNLASSGAIAVGNPDAATTVSVYFDFLCPACAQFEQVNHAELDRLVAAGDVALELHPMSFLDPRSDGTRYSTRAGNALATVADAAPEHVWHLYGALYANLPPEGTAGLDDGQIADLAAAAGVPQTVIDRFGDGAFEPWVAKSNQDAFDAGINSTPTVLINGKRVDDDLFVPGRLTELLAAAGPR